MAGVEHSVQLVSSGMKQGHLGGQWESELMVVRVIQLAQQLVHIGWGIPSSEGDRASEATHNIDCAIQYLCDAILQSMMTFTSRKAQCPLIGCTLNIPHV